MAKQVQLRRGTTTEHATFTGASGELTIDTDKDTVVVHDGAQAGGYPLLRQDMNNVPAGTITSTMIANGTIVNEDISATAEIAVSKLADGSARQLLQTDAAGTGVEWTSNIDVPGTLDVTGAATFDNSVTVQGDLTINGTTTTIDTQNLSVEDKNIEIGKVTTPSNTTADGGGITLKGATDKTLNWVNSTGSWTSSENLDLASGKTYKINGTDVISATALGSAVQISSDNIPNGTVTNDDLAGSIADSKLNTISTANKVSLAALDIDGGTDIGAAIVDADLFIVDDGGAGTNRKAAASRITDYTFNKVSGDVTIASNGTAAIGTGVIVNADISASAAIDKTKISGTAITAADTGTVTSTMIADGTIVDGDINASAAIAHSKLASLTSGNILLGNASNVATSTAVTGDVTISNTGVTAIGTGVIVDADVSASAAIAGSKIQAASTTNAGAVQLTDSTSSTSTTTAATPNSVKSAYDLANAALPLTGGTVTGNVTLSNQVDLRFGEATGNGTNWVAFQAPANITTNITWTLPATDATVSGHALKSDASGNLSWGTAGGATGGSTDDVFYENAQTVTTSYTLTSNKNAMSAGPITINSGATVTIPSGQSWVIV